MGHREQLLAGAKRCLYERGYARTTARDIVAASGTNLASIGYHFGSKEALLNAAVMEAFEEWGEELERAMPGQGGSGESGEEQLVAMWTRVTKSFQSHRPLLVASIEAFAQAEHAPELRKQLADDYERARGAMAEFIAPGDAREDNRVARAVGSLHLAMLAGLSLQWLLDGERAPTGQDMVDALRAVGQGLGVVASDVTDATGAPGGDAGSGDPVVNEV
ncbi:TetR/AcrR family transcriptional regulator [Streptomyces sp. DSM 3412]|uniref:TetR/AcrR family transcriptional regulator n=1 Tax=Streptomyces gottesmaniae TaxID=3075518 RepID=A0ABU2Z8V3_9ACTN|nr:TetR/AcrR family transcriptional regulator [Streptomyces sp. DSM 3412]MDT0571847.1 TetR/AcrR family transcriptional regulator [Streptomyces sp. DSM 3412]